MKKLVDSMIFDLAEHMLKDVDGAKPEDIGELAEAIQETCEDYISAIHEDKENGRGPIDPD